MTRDRSGAGARRPGASPDGDGGTIHTFDRLEDLPEPVPDADFVVVDVIISSTTVVRVLEAGARYVRPVADVEAALAFADRTDDAFLVGEQGGRAIEGFDSGPLPSVLEGYDLADRPVAILTSNGTRAVDRIGHDRDIFVASTVNAGAVASALAGRDRDVLVVAAGRAGDPAPEDTAGAELLARHCSGTLTEDTRERLKEEIRTSDAARWIAELGYDHEVEALLQFDSSETVPRMRDGVFVAE